MNEAFKLCIRTPSLKWNPGGRFLEAFNKPRAFTYYWLRSKPQTQKAVNL